MSRCLIFSFTWIYFSLVYVQAQPMVTKETKVLLVMDFGDKDFKTIELFNDKNNMETLSIKYPGHGIYIGLLQGGYKLQGNGIEPEKDALITIFTNQQPDINGRPLPNENLQPGNKYTIGNNRTEVVSNKKGELILKMK